MNMLQNLPFLSATRWFLSKDDSPPSATAFDGSVLRSREEPEKSGKEDDFAAVKSKLKHGYNINVESMRVTEYPYLRGA